MPGLKESPKVLNSASQYHAAMAEMEELIEKGVDNLNDKELSRIDELSESVHEYESNKYPMPMANSISGILQGYMEANNINRTTLGTVLDISGSTVSDIINKKQGISFPLAVKIHKILHIDAERILSVEEGAPATTENYKHNNVPTSVPGKSKSTRVKIVRVPRKKAAAKKSH